MLALVIKGSDIFSRTAVAMEVLRIQTCYQGVVFGLAMSCWFAGLCRLTDSGLGQSRSRF